jgi:YHS domain-containing protein
MEKDPVCGMDVDPKTAAGKSEYKGTTYYFCSPGCKREFDKDPGKFAGNAQASQGHAH